MRLRTATNLIRHSWLYYLAGLIILFTLKRYYSGAGSDELRWILAPTAMWVRLLGGISFEYVPQAGYVNHAIRFIIAPSCSGVQFMMIAIATLLFSFVHRTRTWRGGAAWVAGSLGASYLFTIFVNGVRIVTAIYLPPLLETMRAGHPLSGRWLTPERLHTAIGVVIYFSSLFVIYRAADHFSRAVSDVKISGCTGIVSESTDTAPAWPLAPVFWYFFITLGVPFLNSAHRNNAAKFSEYAILVSTLCLAVLIGIGLLSAVRRPKRRPPV